MNEHGNTPLSSLFFCTYTHRLMQKFVIYSHNGSWMRWNTQTAFLHMDSPTPNKGRGQCLFYKYKQSLIMNSPKQILKSICPRWNLWVNAWGRLGLSSSKQAVSGVWACKNTCSCTSLPSTGGSDPIFCCYCWRSGKKAGERERRKRKCQKKLAQKSCLKLLKCKKAGDISGIEGLVFVCGHEALLFSILWTCESWTLILNIIWRQSQTAPPAPGTSLKRHFHLSSRILQNGGDTVQYVLNQDQVFWYETFCFCCLLKHYVPTSVKTTAMKHYTPALRATEELQE